MPTFTVTQVAPKPNELKATGSSMDWTAYFTVSQKFTLQVTGTAGDPAKMEVGLNQTMLTSERIATYGKATDSDGVVSLAIKLHSGPPALDADQDTRPWYNAACKAVALPAPGSSLAKPLVMEDGPTTTLPLNIKKGTVTKVISSLRVEDTFLLSVAVYDPAKKPTNNAEWNKCVQKQWKWSMAYDLQSNGAAYPKPVITVAKTKCGEAVEATGSMVAEGDVATTEPTIYKSTPADWAPYYPVSS